MECFILRHGKAGKRDADKFPDDSKRPLTQKGREEMLLVASAFQKMELCFDLVLSSPYKRARQTVGPLVKALSLEKRVCFTDYLIPGASPEKLLGKIEKKWSGKSSILLVGHEPFLSEFMEVVLSPKKPLDIILKKPSLVKLKIKFAGAASRGKLKWLLGPSHLRLLSLGA